MREILFRGKRVDNGEWVEGELLHDMKGRPWIYWTTPKELPVFFLRSAIVKSETVGQYTGENDKDGKKIFEGDIVNYAGMPKIYMIDFHEEFLHYSLFYYDKELKNIYYCGIVHKNDGKFLEVIGNIYDNPELLEVER